MLRNYYSQESLGSLLSKLETLLVLPFGMPCKPGDLGTISIGLNELGEAQTHEVWALTGAEIRHGLSGRCQWSKSDEVMAGAVWLDEADCQDLVPAIEQAYQELLDLMGEMGYSHPYRFWNYIADINKGDADEECYKKFCGGRLNAFSAKGVVSGQFPAASALGHHRQGAVIYFFAGRKPANHHQNAMQLNAYEYPPQYGASSPSFARATSIQYGEQPYCFLSGTASIVGHLTTCADSLQGQLNTTIDNIRHLLGQDGVQALNLQTMKVYLRYADDYEQAQQLLELSFPCVPKLFAHADICRKDLLVEIECFCG